MELVHVVKPWEPLTLEMERLKERVCQVIINVSPQENVTNAQVITIVLD